MGLFVSFDFGTKMTGGYLEKYFIFTLSINFKILVCFDCDTLSFGVYLFYGLCYLRYLVEFS